MKNVQLLSLSVLASALLCGCVYYSNDTHRTTGRLIDDNAIAGKVKDALADSAVYKFPHVHVATYNGVVQLSGFVVKDEQKVEAAELARRVSGVTEVINNISLAPQGPIPASQQPVGRARPYGTNPPVPPGS